MHVTPTHDSLYYQGNEVARYGKWGNSLVAVWYHDGIRHAHAPSWAMDMDVFGKLNERTDLVLIADATQHAVYMVERDLIPTRTKQLGGRKQYYLTSSYDHVHKLGEPTTILGGHLWVESGNQKDTHYHVKRGEA